MSPALLFSLFSAAMTVLVLAVAVRGERWIRSANWLAAFAAGALIVLAIFHLAPEALTKSPFAAAFILLGVIAGAVIHRGVGWVSGSGKKAALGLAPAIGVGFHSFVDGWVYAAGFSADLVTGALTALSLMAHELPEAAIVYMLLISAGFRPMKAVIWAIIAGAATTPLGVLIATPFVTALNEAQIGAMLGLSSGLLAFVGTASLATILTTEPARRVWPALAAGGAMGAALAFLHLRTH